MPRQRHPQPDRSSLANVHSGRLIRSGRSVSSVRSRTSCSEVWRITLSLVQLVISSQSLGQASHTGVCGRTCGSSERGRRRHSFQAASAVALAIAAASDEANTDTPNRGQLLVLVDAEQKAAEAHGPSTPRPHAGWYCISLAGTAGDVGSREPFQLNAFELQIARGFQDVGASNIQVLRKVDLCPL